jgi:hypothetical protein
MTRRSLRLAGCALFLASCAQILPAAPVRAQLALPGAAAGAAAGDDVSAPKPKKTGKKSASGKSGSGKAEKLAPPGLDSVVGKPLMLNGEFGLLQISGSGDSVQIDKLKLAGEGVSDQSQRCVVDIVGATPIKATKVDAGDGLDRYEAEVPACPFSFDVLSGAVLVPAQITACVFKAADCQTSPGGLWGPDGASLQPQADAIARRRTQAEKSIGKTLQAIEQRAGDNKDAAALLDDQKTFPAQRDDACRGYQKEPALGFCAANLTEARAILLETRLAGFAGGSKEAKTDKPKKKPPHKKHDKPAAAAPADDATQQN